MLKFLGGTFLMIGAVVGGGILAIPIVSANFGFLTTVIFIIIAWLIMTKTGLYVLDLSLSCPEKYNSYYSIVGKFLGVKVQTLTIILFLWLLYFSLSSYISGCVSLIMSHLDLTYPGLSYFNLSLIYVIVFGSLIIISSKIIIRLNVVLVMLKLSLLILAIIFCNSHHSLFFSTGKLTIQQTGAFSFLLIIINAFGFQFIVPSLVTYYGRDNKTIFKWMLIVSTTTVLLLYLAWTYSIYSLIPLTGKHGLQAIYHSKNQLLAFNASLLFYLHSKITINILSLFEMVALFGSFFCVALGVFDFLADAFKTQHRLTIGFITFLPPLLLTLFSENMYIQAMSAAGYIALVLEIIIPICAHRKKMVISVN